MDARRNFRRGGGGRHAQKKAPTRRKALHAEKGPHTEKNVAKRPPLLNNLFHDRISPRGEGGGGGERLLLQDLYTI